MKVLIVDDDDSILDFMVKVVEGYQGESFEVLKAKDGPEAMVLYQKYRPKLLFIDMIMPQMHGLDLIRKIKAENDEKINIWAITGYEDNAILEEVEKVPIIVKPFDVEDVEIVLDAIASERQ